MLDALAGDRVGAFNADAGVSPTGTASTNKINLTAHGFANGDIVVFTALTGGAGLVVGRPYFVVTAAANDFEVALIPAGAAVDFTTDVTASTLRRLVELSGGSPAYARKVIAWNAAASGTMDDSTNGAVIDVPANKTVNYLGLWNSTSSDLLAIDDVDPEPYTNQGTYTVTDADLDLLVGA